MVVVVIVFQMHSSKHNNENNELSFAAGKGYSLKPFRISLALSSSEDIFRNRRKLSNVLNRRRDYWRRADMAARLILSEARGNVALMYILVISQKGGKGRISVIR